MASEHKGTTAQITERLYENNQWEISLKLLFTFIRLFGKDANKIKSLPVR